MAAVVFLILFIPQPAQASFLNTLLDASLEALAHIIAGLSFIIFQALGFLLTLAGKLYDLVLFSVQFQQFAKAPFVQTGWAISLGVANMFFSLILLIIAFATILRIESYGVKQVLPRLIIAALLINFSLVIGGIIIDFSQVMTMYFANAIKNGSSVSAQIMKVIDPLSLLKAPPGTAALITGNTASVSSSNMPSYMGMTLPAGCTAAQFQQDGCAALAKSQAQAQDTATANSLVNTGTGTDKFLNTIVNLLFGSILLIIATFVMFAGAILLLIRVLVLWFLLILAPMAWLLYILPATHSYFSMWWSKFFKQALFAPAYAFFLYLAIKILVASGGPISAAGTASPAFNPQYILNFIIVIGLLLGALMAAQQMGAVGASTFMGFAKTMQKWGTGAAKFTVRKGTGYDKVAPAVVAGIGKALGSKTLQGRALQMKEKQLERPENKAYARYLSSLAPNEIERELKSASGTKALMAARAAKESKILDNANPAVARQAMATFRAFGQIKEARELEEVRPDAIDTSKDSTAQNEAIQRALANGSYKRWSSRVFESESGKNIAEKLRTQLPIADYISSFKGMSKQVQETAREAMKANLDIGGEGDEKRRSLYAAATGRIAEAFTDKSGNLNGEAVARHIGGMAPVHIGSVNVNPENDSADLKLIGKYVTVGQLQSIRGELSNQQKKMIKEGAKMNKAVVQEFLDEQPAWNVENVEKKRIITP